MGSQQLLLIVVGVVVIGIMVIIGIVMFTDHSAATSRDAIANDLMHAASKAQLYKRRPRIQGGGGGSFVGFNLQTVFRTLTNANATFAINGTPTDSLIVIEGVGLMTGYDSVNPLKVSIDVYGERVEVKEVN